MKISTVGSVEKHKQVKDMRVGETCWMVPWAVRYNDGGEVVDFDKASSVDDRRGAPGTTVQLGITKTGPDSYVFDATHCGYYKR